MELLSTNEMGEGAHVLSYFSFHCERGTLVYSGTGETRGGGGSQNTYTKSILLKSPLWNNSWEPSSIQIQILSFGQSIKHGQLLENSTLPVSLHL